MRRILLSTLSAFICCGSFSALDISGATAGQYAKMSDDLQLYYEEAGQGQPVLLIPGWTASTVVFAHQIEHLSKTRRVIAYDPRSQGMSSRTLDNNSYAQHGRDLAALIERLGLKHVTLVAWSAACFDAYAYIRTVGTDNLAAFVCIDNPPRGVSANAGDWAMGDASDKGLAEIRDIEDALRADRRGMFQEFFKFMNAREVSPQEADWFIRQNMLTPTYAALLLHADFLFVDYREEARKIDGKLPVLNVISDPSADPAISWIKANTPHSEIFRIKRHMSFWSEPESFNAGLDAFLAKVP